MGQEDNLTGSFMAQFHFLPLIATENATYPWQGRKEVANFRDIFRVLHIDMGQLMVTNGKGSTGIEVEGFSKRPRSNVEQASMTEGAIRLHYLIDLNMTIFADHPDPGTPSRGFIEKRCAGLVELRGQSGHIAAFRAKSLRLVVKMREVDEGQIWFQIT